jgi:trk system potassium uptake protein TrkH
VVLALVALLGVAMLLPLGFALLDGGPDASGIALAAGISLLIGGIGFSLLRKGVDDAAINHREGFAIVAFGWVAASLFGALPFLLYAHLSGACAVLQPAEGTGPPGWELCTITDAVFEATSGFTTTGATILTHGLWDGPEPGSDSLPRGILLWRALSHWLGGMGILLLAVAILPLLGVGGMQLMRAEVPGPTADRLAPRVAETARVLWIIYAALTALEAVLLALGGINWFESICHAFATMATGGFSTRALSVEGFHSAYLEWITIAFMFLAGANFSLHYVSLRGRPWAHLRDPEFRFYAGIALLFTGLIGGTLLLHGAGGGHEALRSGAFQAVSILTTTGFSSTDFEAWDALTPALPFFLILLMFVGGSAGSTGGGVKCARVYLLIRQGLRELQHLIHPHAVLPVRLGKRVVERDVLRSVTGFFVLYVFCMAAAATLLSIMGLDSITAITAAAATLGNIGPGLGGVGPADNYHFLPAAAKWICSFCMLLGRLELYTILVLLVPDFWRR